MLEDAACDGTEDAVAQDDKHGGGFASIVGEGIDISVVGTFDEAMGFEFTQVVCQLIAGILLGCEVIGIQDVHGCRGPGGLSQTL